MDCKSLLEILEEEKKLCDRLQSVANMRKGLYEAAQEGRTNLDRRQALIDRLDEESAQLHDELFRVRSEIAARLKDYGRMYGG